MESIELSPRILEWAASQAGADIFEIARKVSTRSAEKIVAGHLSYAQVLKYAKLTGVSLGLLFLDEPPRPRELPLADFRTLPDANPLSRDFFEVFDDIDFKQSWMKERLQIEGADPIWFVGKYKHKSPAPEVLAEEMRITLGFTQQVIQDVKNSDQLFSKLADLCEQNRVFVFKNGVVGNKTRRPLSVSEFRGFAIADPICPFIFINGADAPAAWVFTLAHELAHIWLGDSGISDAAPGTQNKVEQYCNSVAGEFLVPKQTFVRVWNELPDESVNVRLEIARRTFKVSKTVVARRAYDLNFISKDDYLEVYYSARQAAKDKNASGGDFYRTLAIRNSKKFSRQVVDLAITGSITLGQAGRLLNTNPNKVVRLHEKNALSI